MRKAMMTVCASLCAVVAMGQGTVKGRVIDKQSNEALQFVTVNVVDAATGKFVKGGITDLNGSFNIDELPLGNYKLNVTYVGYKNNSRTFTLSKSKHQASFPAVYLAEDAHSLGEVKVTGQRSQMKLEVDRKSFTVDQMIASVGGSASDLLESIPSVEVTTDGEISLKGNTSVEVWINGKASGLTSDNRGDILQQIPAESIERIEVIDNPSAKYSPEGSAGIINIILKRDRKAGYYGSVRAGADTKGGWNAGGNINYTSGKIEAYGNLSYRKRKGTGGSLSEQTFPLTHSYQNYDGDSQDHGGNVFARAGLTWHLTEKDEIGLSGMTMHGSHDDLSNTLYHYGALGAAADSRQMMRTTSGEGSMHMYHAELDYTHQFAEKHKLSLNVSFDKWKNDNDNYYRDSTSYTDGATPTAYSYQYRPMHINNRSWEVKLDYENQLSEQWKLEAGYNGRFNHENTPQESWADAASYDGANALLDEAFFNRFIYDMDVHALYATLNAKLGRFGVMAGLRGEYWKVNTESYTYEQEHDASKREPAFKKDYFQLFPSLFLNYELTKSSQIQLNYTRRLRRPWGGQLNSFKDTRDASMVSFGNPELTPEYTHSLSLNYLKTWDNHTLSFGGYYRPTTDVIQRVTYSVPNADGSTVMYSTNENVAKSQSAGVELILKDKLFRILDLTTTLNAYYYKLDGFSYDINSLTVTGQADESFAWDARILASFVLPYDISIQATGNYRSRQTVTQGYRKPNASLDIGLRKTFFNKALTLSINCRDVLNTRKWNTYTSSDSFERHQKNWRDPKVHFTLAWNFGNMTGKKKQQAHQGDDGGSDQQNSYTGSEY